MNKVTVEEINKMARGAQQAQDGQFSLGSTEQQYAARFVEKYFTEYDIIDANADDMDKHDFAVAVINALRDLQVRDYVLGIMNADNMELMQTALNYLVEVSPDKYQSPLVAMLSLTHYETGNEEKAIELLSKADSQYPLATLLRRVFTAGWPINSFQQMRNELHPKVVATIFGEDK